MATTITDAHTYYMVDDEGSWKAVTVETPYEREERECKEFFNTILAKRKLARRRHE